MARAAIFLMGLFLGWVYGCLATGSHIGLAYGVVIGVVLLKLYDVLGSGS